MSLVKFKIWTLATICLSTSLAAASMSVSSSVSSSAATPSMSAPAPTAKSLLDGWKNSIYTDHEHSKLSLTLIDPGAGTVERHAEIWYKESANKESRILMRFQSPTSIRGVAFLSLQGSGESNADQWLYLPAFKKSRRLSSHSRDESFLDSDFTNGDISFQYENAFDFKLIGEKVIGNQPVYVLEGKVKASRQEGLAYSREVLYFRKGDKLNVRAEFYDLGNKLSKIMTVEKWTKYQNRWAANRIEIENARTKHKSILEFTGRETDSVPADRLFTMSELESGR